MIFLFTKKMFIHLKRAVQLNTGYINKMCQNSGNIIDPENQPSVPHSAYLIAEVQNVSYA